MTPFEIIILAIIYLICYGFILTFVLKKADNDLNYFWAIICLALALYAPLVIGGMLYEKLKDE